MIKILLLLFPLITLAQTFQYKRKELPLYEVGAGVGYANLPYYEGAKERRSVTLPFPTFLYRGDIIRADEDGGLRSRFKFSDSLELNAAFGFSLPVDSEIIEVRKGMDDLDTLFELGPGLIYHGLKITEDRPFSLSVNLAARYAMTTDLNFTKGQGWVLNPIVYSRIKMNKEYSGFLSVSQKWAEKSYQQYYYDVEEKDQTNSREEYQAEGGVLSTRYAGFLAYQPNFKTSIAMGVIYFNYDNAANRESPLHVKDDNFSFILGFTYWFYQSEQTVN